MHKVTRHALTTDGATFTSHDEDFVVSDNLDFHPTDVLEDADGSLLIVDTGGWYKLCCPTSQLWKPEILGGIYRVRRNGAPAIADPRGLKIAWSQLTPGERVKLLADPRPAVASRAIRELGARKSDSVEALAATIRRSEVTASRLGAVWALSRIGTDTSRAAIRQALDDSDELVRQSAIHAVSVARDEQSLDQLVELLKTSSTPQNRRAAAEALGRLGHAKAVPALLSAAGDSLDRTLEHSVTYALIEIADPAATRAGLADEKSGTRKAALVAIDQMDGGGLEPEYVAELLTGPDPQLAEVAAWILQRHSDWARPLVPWLSRGLATGALAGDQAPTYLNLLSRFSESVEVQKLVAVQLEADAAKSNERGRLLQAMAASGLKVLPDSWTAALARVLQSDDTVVAPVVAVVRAIPKISGESGPLRSALLAAASNDRLPANVRLEALAVVPGGPAELGSPEFEFVRANLVPDAQLSVRVAAADVLSKSRLEDKQLLALVDSVRTAGPLEIEGLLAPFARSTDSAVGMAVIDALANCAALTNVRAETLTDLFRNSQPAVQEQSQALYKLQAAGASQRMAKIEDLLARVTTGDVQRGQLVFNGQKAACATCHAIGYLGGTVGPDLTRIGQIRSERDLLEAIVFPSASFVRSYEPITVATITGKTFSGLLRKDAPDEVVLAINAKETVRIPRAEIDQMAPATVSIMPAGLDQQLSTQELVDLVAFLRACK